MTAHARGSRRGIPDSSVKDGVIGLLGEALKAVPRLDGARCRGQARLFDALDLQDRVAAIALCRRCDALTACQEWAAAEDRPLIGVVAAKYRGSGKDSQWCRRRRDDVDDTKTEGTHHDNA